MTTQVSTALAPIELHPPQALVPTERTYALIEKAASMALSGAVALPKELNTRDKVAAVMLYGWELGLRPMTALQELYIVNGRVQPSARIMAGLLMSRTDGRIVPEETTDKKCTLRLIWPSRNINETYTVEWQEIVTAKLATRDVWATYPRDKLITHCTKRLLRVFAPDVINGLVGPVFESQDAEDEPEDVDERELFNPGEHAYIDGHVVNRETGEIEDTIPSDEADVPVDDPRGQTEAQRAAIVDWQEGVRAKHGPEGLAEVVRVAKERWAYAVEGNALHTGRLTEADSSEYIGLLKSKEETKRGAASQPSLTS